MKTVWKFTLDVVPPSFNVYDRMHWAVKKKLRETLGRRVMFALFEQGWRMPADRAEVPPMMVSVVICRPRRLDPDSATASLKPLLDGMRDVRALRNDSPRWLKLEVDQEISAVPRTEITISEWYPTRPAVRAQFKLEGV